MSISPENNRPDLWLSHFQWPTAADHKYQRGHVLVWGGPRMVGAARLAARAAARAGAGLVSLVVPSAAWPVYAAHLMSGMAHPLADSDAETLQRAWHIALNQLRWRALVLGPGASVGLPEDAQTTMRGLVHTALTCSAQRTVVLDADALTAFERCEGALFRAIRAQPCDVVLTPHEGEFARLFANVFKPLPASPPPDRDDKVGRTCQAAHQSGAVVVHKGASTVVASPDGRVVVNTHAPAWLATAGAGDVLAGMVAALCAQGLPAFEAACMATWAHGECATRLGPGLIAEDLPEQLPAVLRALKPV